MIEKIPPKASIDNDDEQQKLNATINNDSVETDTSHQKKPSRKAPRANKSLYGIPLAIGCAFCHSISSIIVKKSYLLSGSEHTTIRYLIQLLSMSLVVCYKKIDIRNCRKEGYLLVPRALLGVIGLISAYFAISFIDPADSSSIINSSIVITALLSRIFLSEKLSIVHMVSILTAVVGIFFISQPTFLFPASKVIIDLGNNFTNQSAAQKSFRSTTDNAKFYTTVGLFLASFTAFVSSIVTILLKKLSNHNVHYSLNILFTSMLGLPVSIIISLVLNFTSESKLAYHFQNNLPELLTHVLYSVISSLIGVLAQVMFNLSLHYEDASKISIVKTSEIFFAFLLQYLILNIESNVFKVVGGVLIFVSGAAILTYKIFDQKHSKRKRKRKELQLASGRDTYQKQSGCCVRLLFFKF